MKVPSMVAQLFHADGLDGLLVAFRNFVNAPTSVKNRSETNFESSKNNFPPFAWIQWRIRNKSQNKRQRDLMQGLPKCELRNVLYFSSVCLSPHSAIQKFVAKVVSVLWRPFCRHCTFVCNVMPTKIQPDAHISAQDHLLIIQKRDVTVNIHECSRFSFWYINPVS